MLTRRGGFARLLRRVRQADPHMLQRDHHKRELDRGAFQGGVRVNLAADVLANSRVPDRRAKGLRDTNRLPSQGQGTSAAETVRWSVPAARGPTHCDGVRA